MDEDQDRMYVGCKDHVLSMDLNNITHGTLKVSRWFELTREKNRFLFCSAQLSFLLPQKQDSKTGKNYLLQLLLIIIIVGYMQIALYLP